MLSGYFFMWVRENDLLLCFCLFVSPIYLKGSPLFIHPFGTEPGTIWDLYSVT